MNKLRILLICIKDCPKIKKCRNEAIKLKGGNYYNDVPVVQGLIDEIIENPFKHYNKYIKHVDMDDYVEYLNYKDQSAS